MKHGTEVRPGIFFVTFFAGPDQGGGYVREVSFEEWKTWVGLGAEPFASVNGIGGAVYIGPNDRGTSWCESYGPPTWNSWFIRVENPDG